MGWDREGRKYNYAILSYSSTRTHINPHPTSTNERMGRSILSLTSFMSVDINAYKITSYSKGTGLSEPEIWENNKVVENYYLKLLTSQGKKNSIQAFRLHFGSLQQNIWCSTPLARKKRKYTTTFNPELWQSESTQLKREHGAWMSINTYCMHQRESCLSMYMYM